MREGGKVYSKGGDQGVRTERQDGNIQGKAPHHAGGACEEMRSQHADYKQRGDRSAETVENY